MHKEVDVAGSLCHVICFLMSDSELELTKGRAVYCCNIKILAGNVWSEKKGRNYLLTLNLICFAFTSTL